MRDFSGRRKRGIAAVGVIAALGVLASVAVAATPPLNKLKGSVSADGSSTVGPYTTAAAELFSRAGAKNVRVTVGISGTGGGFERFCKGEIDLSDASRPMKIKEAAICKANNIGSWRAFTVANDALTVVVNKDNTWATCLSTDELKKIWNTGSKVDNWKDVRAGLPRPEDQALRPGHRLRHVRLLHRGDQRQGQGEPVGLCGVRGRQRARPGRVGREGRPRLLRLLVLRGEPGQAEGGQVKNPKTGNCVAPSARPHRTARTSRSRGRSSSTRRARRSSGPRCRRSSGSSSTTRSRSRSGRISSRSPRPS